MGDFLLGNRLIEKKRNRHAAGGVTDKAMQMQPLCKRGRNDAERMTQQKRYLRYGGAKIEEKTDMRSLLSDMKHSANHVFQQLYSISQCARIEKKKRAEKC